MSKWLAIETDDGAHVLPVSDVVEHEETGDCVCGPSVEQLTRTDGGDSWLTTHHSLDGRELTEPDHA